MGGDVRLLQFHTADDGRVFAMCPPPEITHMATELLAAISGTLEDESAIAALVRAVRPIARREADVVVIECENLTARYAVEPQVSWPDPRTAVLRRLAGSSYKSPWAC